MQSDHFGPGSPKIEVVRSVDAGSFLETFLVSAVAAVLAIRAFLGLTGYPRLGNEELHIAHVLWGGLLMLAATVLMLAFLGRWAKWTGAIVGGIGFGTFIDEVGKFLTSDNDYFFRPAVALIYVVFVLLFLLSRAIERRLELSPHALLANAANTVVEMLLNGATPEEAAEALDLLRRSESRSDVAQALRQAVLAVPRAREVPPSLASKLAAGLRRGYGWLIAWSWFQRAVVLLFVGRGFLLIAVAVVESVRRGPLEMLVGDGSIVAVGNLAASGASSATILVGIACLPGSRLRAYRWFKRSVLISVFFVQAFLFYENQLGALAGLGLDLLLLVGLNYMIREEHSHEEWPVRAVIGSAQLAR